MRNSAGSLQRPVATVLKRLGGSWGLLVTPTPCHAKPWTLGAACQAPSSTLCLQDLEPRMQAFATSEAQLFQRSGIHICRLFQCCDNAYSPPALRCVICTMLSRCRLAGTFPSAPAALKPRFDLRKIFRGFSDRSSGCSFAMATRKHSGSASRPGPHIFRHPGENLEHTQEAAKMLNAGWSKSSPALPVAASVALGPPSGNTRSTDKVLLMQSRLCFRRGGLARGASSRTSSRRDDHAGGGHGCCPNDSDMNLCSAMSGRNLLEDTRVTRAT